MKRFNSYLLLSKVDFTGGILHVEPRKREVTAFCLVFALALTMIVPKLPVLFGLAAGLAIPFLIWGAFSIWGVPCLRFDTHRGIVDLFTSEEHIEIAAEDGAFDIDIDHSSDSETSADYYHVGLVVHHEEMRWGFPLHIFSFSDEDEAMSFADTWRDRLRLNT